MNLEERVIVDPKIMAGKPVIKGTRVTLEAILKRLAEGLSVEEVLEDYSYLTMDDIRATLLYVAKVSKMS